MEHLTITHAKLMAEGLTPQEVATAVREGRLRKLRRGVYMPAREENLRDDHLALVEATRQVIGSANVLSHTSAGLLRDLPVRKASLERATFTRLTPGHGDKQRHLLMRNTAITEGEFEVHGTGLVTTLARTMSDLARTEPRAWGVAAMDAGLRQGADKATVAGVLALHPRLSGVRKARAVLEFADPLAESPLESISRYNLQLAGLPVPELQVEHFDEDGVFVARTDCFWREAGVVGECHGMHKYGALLEPGQSVEDVLREEHRRRQALIAMGYAIVEWDWDVGTDPRKLAARVAPVLLARSGA